MRTTLTIDDDVLAAVRAIADRERRSIGEIVSELARRSLVPGDMPKTRNGVTLLPVRPGAIVTLDHVNALRDELP